MVNKIYNNAKTAHTKKTKENLLQLLEILKIWIMIDKLKIAIIVQAREESVRFPKKVLYPILGKPLRALRAPLPGKAKCWSVENYPK